MRIDPLGRALGPRAVVTSLAALSFALATSCSGPSAERRGSSSNPGPEETGTSRTQSPAPPWFHTPPKSPTSLYFVGDASSQSDEASARDLAIQKAMGELTNYCGATVSSNFSSKEREQNGRYEYVVSMTVDVAGDELTVREAVVKQTVVGKGSDGKFDAYALVEWPRSQFEEVQTMQRSRANRALDRFKEARQAVDERDAVTARARLEEAKAILRPMRSTVAVDDPKIHDTTLLLEAVNTLATQLSNVEEERRDVIAVEVSCNQDGADQPCKPELIGAMRETVTDAGLKVSTRAVDKTMVLKILNSETPKAEASTRTASHVLAVRFSVNALGQTGPFKFVRCGARGVLFNTTSERIVAFEEVPPVKGGHISLDGAIARGCGEASHSLATWATKVLKNDVSQEHATGGNR